MKYQWFAAIGAIAIILGVVLGLPGNFNARSDEPIVTTDDDGARHGKAPVTDAGSADVQHVREPDSSWSQAKRKSAEAAESIGRAASETARRAWESTTTATEEAADAASRASSNAWEKTRDASASAWDAASDGTKRTANEAAKVGADALQKTRETSQRVWDATTKKASDAAKAIRGE